MGYSTWASLQSTSLHQFAPVCKQVVLKRTAIMLGQCRQRLLVVLSLLPNSPPLTILLVWTMYYLGFAARRPSLHLSAKPKSRLKRIMNRMSLLHTKFYPCFAATSGLFQTALMSLRPRVLNNYRRQVIHLDDGGTIALDWLDNDALPPNAPCLVIWPGLMGGGHEEYIAPLASAAVTRGWRAVVYCRRGCGGLALETPKPQNYADRKDVLAMLSHVRARLPDARLIGVGFSLGGNYLINLLSHCNQHPSVPKLEAAVAICAPYDLVGVSYWLQHVNRICDRVICSQKRNKLLPNRAVLESAEASSLGLSMDKIIAGRSYREMSTFHEQIAWGWPTLNQMLDSASCHHSLPSITTPLLCINTLDDPLCHPNFLPLESFTRNDSIALAICARGGHHSFIGNWFGGLNYGERVALQFLDAALTEPQKSQTLSRSRSKSWSSGDSIRLSENTSLFGGSGERRTQVGRVVLAVLIWPIIAHQLSKWGSRSALGQRIVPFAQGGLAFLASAWVFAVWGRGRKWWQGHV